MMSRKLYDLFEKANDALFYLHQEMDDSMKLLPGKETWREDYGMRLRLANLQTMTENNFKDDVKFPLPVCDLCGHSDCDGHIGEGWQ